MTSGRTFGVCNSTGVPDAGVDRQWYAIDGDPTAGGSLYLANDEVGTGNVQCGTTQVNNVLVMYRSPVNGAAGATAGVPFGPAEQDHAARRRATRGSWGTTRSARSRRGPASSVGGHRPRSRPGQARLRDPRRRQPDQDSDRPLLPGRVRASGRERQRPERPQLRRPPGREPRRSEPNPHGWQLPDARDRPCGQPLRGLGAGADERRASPATRRSITRTRPTRERRGRRRSRSRRPGLSNNVFAWVAAGDDGRVDIAWYGTPPTSIQPAARRRARTAGRTPSRPVEPLSDADADRPLDVGRVHAPVLASEHPDPPRRDPDDHRQPVRRRNQSRSLRHDADARRLLPAPDRQQGRGTDLVRRLENIDGNLMGSHAMFVSQIGGTGVLAAAQPKGDSILQRFRDRSGRRRDLRRARACRARRCRTSTSSRRS